MTRHGRPFPPSELTPREREVLRRLVAGQTNREIAADCGITVQSVKNVLSSVYAKWHVRNRVELAVRAVRDGVVSDAEIARGAPNNFTDEDFGHFRGAR